MMTSIKYSLLLSILFTANHVGYSQEKIGEKYEKEIKIKKEDFPENALNILSPILQKDKRSRFYKEINQDNYSYEYKSTYNTEKLSIKFDQNGQLEDIEVKQDFTTITDDIGLKILDYFNNNFQKYKLNKIQFQYAPAEHETKSDAAFFKQFLEQDLNQSIIKYEIEGEVIDAQKERGYYEFVFSTTGEIEKVREIIQRADDNILY
jgi:hypothetical protein